MGWWLLRAEIWIPGLGYIFRYKISIQKISFLGENIMEVLPLSCTVNHQHWEERLITILFFFLKDILVWSQAIDHNGDFHWLWEGINPDSRLLPWMEMGVQFCSTKVKWTLHQSRSGGEGTFELQTWTPGARRGTASLLHTLICYWKGWGSSMCFIWTLVFVVWIEWIKYKRTLGRSLLSSQLFERSYRLHRKHHTS